MFQFQKNLGEPAVIAIMINAQTVGCFGVMRCQNEGNEMLNAPPLGRQGICQINQNLTLKHLG